MFKISEFIADINRFEFGGTQAVDELHKPTPEELYNVARLVVRTLCGLSLKSIDFARIVARAGDVSNMADLRTNFARSVAKFVLGYIEDGSVSEDDMTLAVSKIAMAFFTYDEGLRNEMSLLTFKPLFAVVSGMLYDKLPDGLPDRIKATTSELFGKSANSAKAVLMPFIYDYSADKSLTSVLGALDSTSELFDQLVIAMDRQAPSYREEFTICIEQLLIFVWCKVSVGNS